MGSMEFAASAESRDSLVPFWNPNRTESAPAWNQAFLVGVDPKSERAARPMLNTGEVTVLTEAGSLAMRAGKPRPGSGGVTHLLQPRATTDADDVTRGRLVNDETRMVTDDDATLSAPIDRTGATAEASEQAYGTYAQASRTVAPRAEATTDSTRSKRFDIRRGLHDAGR